MAELKIADFQWNIGQNLKFRKTFLIILSEFHRDFWLIREGNDISNTHGKFQDHTISQFFKMATFIFLRWQPPPVPVPAVFDVLPGGVTPTFFIKMTAKGFT